MVVLSEMTRFFTLAEIESETVIERGRTRLVTLADIKSETVSELGRTRLTLTAIPSAIVSVSEIDREETVGAYF